MNRRAEAYPPRIVAVAASGDRAHHAVALWPVALREELRRAMGFKRSEKRMAQLEGLLREGMAKHGITGETADRIVRAGRITAETRYSLQQHGPRVAEWLRSNV